MLLAIYPDRRATPPAYSPFPTVYRGVLVSNVATKKLTDRSAKIISFARNEDLAVERIFQEVILREVVMGNIIRAF